MSKEPIHDIDLVNAKLLDYLYCDTRGMVSSPYLALMDEGRIETLARQHGIRQKRDDGGLAKVLGAFLRRADEGALSRLMVETTILLAASRTNPATVLRDAATAYKVNTDAIALKVKQEFAAKEKAKKAPQPVPKAAKKAG